MAQVPNLYCISLEQVSFLPLQDLKAIMMDCVFEQKLQVSKFQGSYWFFHAFTFSTVIFVFTPLSIDVFSKFINKLQPNRRRQLEQQPSLRRCVGHAKEQHITVLTAVVSFRRWRKCLRRIVNSCGGLLCEIQYSRILYSKPFPNLSLHCPGHGKDVGGL